MRMLIGVLLTLLVAALSSAADVTGKWTGSLQVKDAGGQAAVLPAYAEFKQRGDSITGKVWKEVEHQFSIKNGRIAGNRITFEFSAPEGSEDSEPAVHSVRLAVVSEHQLQGEIEFATDGGKMAGNLAFTRDK